MRDGGALGREDASWRFFANSGYAGFLAHSARHSGAIERVLRVEAVSDLREILQTIKQSKIFRDFRDSERSETPEKRRK